MKYLKIYEMFDDNQYYTEVSQGDVIINGDVVGVVEFDPIDKKNLELELSPSSVYSHEWEIGYSPDEFGSLKKIRYLCLSDKSRRGCLIYALKDDWYVLQHLVSNTKYYKCDRIDGLIKCLKDKSII